MTVSSTWTQAPLIESRWREDHLLGHRKALRNQFGAACVHAGTAARSADSELPIVERWKSRPRLRLASPDRMSAVITPYPWPAATSPGPNNRRSTNRRRFRGRWCAAGFVPAPPHNTDFRWPARAASVSQCARPVGTVNAAGIASHSRALRHQLPVQLGKAHVIAHRHAELARPAYPPARASRPGSTWERFPILLVAAREW